MPRIIKFEINEENAGIKIFTFLKYRRGFSTKLIRTLKNTKNGITLNGDAARTIDILKVGDELCVSIPEDGKASEPNDTDIDVIYEDEDILAVNKSPFTAMHPTHNHQGDTLANAVSAYLAGKGKACSFRAVGRLDKGTSGIVICTLNPLAASKLSGKTDKTYYAVVKGNIEDEGTVDAPIYRPDPMKTLRACSYELGKESAVTHWQKLAQTDECSLIRLKLETGRTHQIRVHMNYIGHPLAGDQLYGGFMPEIGHQMLFCGECAFTHPVTDERILLKAEPTDEFKALGFGEFFENFGINSHSS